MQVNCVYMHVLNRLGFIRFWCQNLNKYVDNELAARMKTVFNVLGLKFFCAIYELYKIKDQAFMWP